MAVNSTEAPSTTLPFDVAAYTRLFGHLLWQTPGPARVRLLSVMCKAIELDEPSVHIRIWCKLMVNSRGGGTRTDSTMIQHEADTSGSQSVTAPVTSWRSDAARLVKSTFRWDALWIDAQKAVDSSRSVTSATIAAAMVSGLLTPLFPSERVSYTRDLGQRVALACMGMRMLRRSRNFQSVHLSRGRIAYMAGWSLPPTGERLRELIERGLIRRLRGKTLRLNLLDVDGLERMIPFAPTIDALADDTADPVALVIRSVDHPAWGYSETLNHGHWFRLLADAAGVPTAVTGMTVQMRSKLGTGLKKVCLPVNEPGADVVRIINSDLLRVLDEIAEDPAHGRLDTCGRRISANDAQLIAEARRAKAAQQHVDALQVDAEEFEKVAEQLEAKREAEKLEKAENSARPARRSRRDDDDEIAERAALVAEKKSVRVKLDELFGYYAIPEAPHLTDSEGEQGKVVVAWISEVRRAILENDLDGEVRRTGEEIFRQRLTEKDYGPEAATKLVRHALWGEELPVTNAA